MIMVTAEIGEGALTHRQQITAPSIEQALKMAGEGKPGCRVRLLFPIDPKAFFVPESPSKARRLEMEYAGTHRTNEVSASLKGEGRQRKQR